MKHLTGHPTRRDCLGLSSSIFHYGDYSVTTWLEVVSLRGRVIWTSGPERWLRDAKLILGGEPFYTCRLVGESVEVVNPELALVFGQLVQREIRYCQYCEKAYAGFLGNLRQGDMGQRLLSGAEFGMGSLFDQKAVDQGPADREATPLPFARFLVGLAAKCAGSQLQPSIAVTASCAPAAVTATAVDAVTSVQAGCNTDLAARRARAAAKRVAFAAWAGGGA